MWHRSIPAAALCALAACGDSSGPERDPAEYRGLWQVQVGAAQNCWSGYDFRFTIDEDDGGNELLINFVSEWWDPNNPDLKRQVTGNFDTGRDEFTIIFWRAGTQRLRIDGAGADPARTLSGVAVDLDGGWHFTFYDGVCTANATVRKIG